MTDPDAVSCIATIIDHAFAQAFKTALASLKQLAWHLSKSTGSCSHGAGAFAFRDMASAGVADPGVCRRDGEPRPVDDERDGGRCGFRLPPVARLSDRP